jgi:ribonucleoside-diphosphate reductase beta chain
MFSKEDLLNFMKYRVDDSLKKIGMKTRYNVTPEQYRPMTWFEEEVFANSLDDFFAKRPVDYTKHDKSITANDLF